MKNVEPIVFANRDGNKLFGMFHSPSGKEKKECAILLLSPGIKMRVAPHRLYNKMAEKYANMGFSVLRYDFYGLGDAEGQLNEPVLADVYNSVANGRYTDDVFAAMDFIQEKYGYKNFIVGGLCGGAITGLFAAQKDDRIKALLSLGMPVIYEISGSDKSRYITKGQLNSLAEGYGRNLLKPKSWIRLLTFQSDYKVLFRSLKQFILKKIKPKDTNRPKPKQSQAQGSLEVSAKGNLNPLFGPAFFNMLQTKRKVLLIFSGADRLEHEFNEKFEELYHDRLEEQRKFYEKHTIENANHVLSMPEWQNEMLDISCQWLKSI